MVICSPYHRRQNGMNAIEAMELSKTFRVRRKEKGMKGSLRALLHPETEEIKAVLYFLYQYF